MIRLIAQLTLLIAAVLAVPASAGQTHDAEPEWSSAFERFLAPRWVAGEGTTPMDSNRRFRIACDPALGSYLRSLRELDELQAEYRRHPDPRAWAEGRHWAYTCISRNSLRLAGATNLPLPVAENPDEAGINEGYYRVVKEDADSQLIELHYRDHRTDIYDSFYRYEVRGNTVIPLESWEWGRGNFQMFMAMVVAAIFLLIGLAALYKGVRFMVRYKAGGGQRRSDR